MYLLYQNTNVSIIHDIYSKKAGLPVHCIGIIVNHVNTYPSEC